MKRERIVKTKSRRIADAPAEISERRRRRDDALLAQSDAVLDRIDAVLDVNRQRPRKSA